MSSRPRRRRGAWGRNVRIPRDLHGAVVAVTVKFAVGRDGKPGLFEVLTDTPDKCSAAPFAEVGGVIAAWLKGK